MSTETPQKPKQAQQGSQADAVTIYELTDPSAAGEDIEILDQDVVHLGDKPFNAKRVVVNLDKSMFVYHSTSHRTRSRTRLHPALMALMIVGPDSRASVDGHEVDADVLVAGEPGVEVEIVVDDQYQSMTLMLSPDELTQHLRRRGREEAFTMPIGIETWHSNQHEFGGLFELGLRLTETASGEPELLNHQVDVRAAVHSDLLERYLATLQSADHSQSSRVDKTSQRYSRIVKTAQDYVMEQHGAGYSVSDICDVTSTSERTLQNAFRKILDMTPIEYLIRLRLHRVRQELQNAESEAETVSRIAMNWGFWHLGEFAGAYRNCFDEIPSDTLNS